MTRRTISLLEWLTAPLRPSVDAAARRPRLLAWLLVSLAILFAVTAAIAIGANESEASRRFSYIAILSALDVAVIAAYLLNCAGRYETAAWITVACAFAGPWGSAIADPSILQGDFVPIVYTVLAIMLASILLSTVATAIIAVVQGAILTLVALRFPGAVPDWPSLFALLMFASVLSAVSSTVNQRHLEHIDRQAALLRESEMRLRDLSVRDHQTGLFNRRYLEETLARQMLASSRMHGSIGVILFDIDHFKQINDKWGHREGDSLLESIGRVISSHIRESDVACRWGGDEFIIVLPDASLDTACERAEQLRLATKTVGRTGSKGASPSISVGVAVFPEHGQSCESLLDAADRALYDAKTQGRDRVAIATAYEHGLSLGLEPLKA
jgi:diguanylate cyclase (GGDEF)-like protein